MQRWKPGWKPHLLAKNPAIHPRNVGFAWGYCSLTLFYDYFTCSWVETWLKLSHRWESIWDILVKFQGKSRKNTYFPPACAQTWFLEYSNWRARGEALAVSWRSCISALSFSETSMAEERRFKRKDTSENVNAIQCLPVHIQQCALDVCAFNDHVKKAYIGTCVMWAWKGTQSSSSVQMAINTCRMWLTCTFLLLFYIR